MKINRVVGEKEKQKSRRRKAGLNREVMDWGRR